MLKDIITIAMVGNKIIILLLVVGIQLIQLSAAEDAFDVRENKTISKNESCPDPPDCKCQYFGGLLGDGIICAVYQFQSFPKLSTVSKHEFFFIQNNTLTDIPEGAFFSWGGNLTYVDFENNHIEKIHDDAFTWTPNIRFINLANNRITKLSPNVLRAIPLLYSLDLSSNEIKNIHDVLYPTLGYSSYERLTALDLSNNQIENLSSPVANQTFLPNLTLLTLTNNLIKMIPSGAFDRPKKLTKIDLSYNLIANIDKDAFDIQDVNLCLSLSNNSLELLYNQTLEFLKSGSNIYLTLTKNILDCSVQSTKMEGVVVFQSDCWIYPVSTTVLIEVTITAQTPTSSKSVLFGVPIPVPVWVVFLVMAVFGIILWIRCAVRSHPPYYGVEVVPLPSSLSSDSYTSTTMTSMDSRSSMTTQSDENADSTILTSPSSTSLHKTS